MAFLALEQKFSNAARAMRAVAVALPMGLAMGFGQAAWANDGTNTSSVQEISLRETPQCAPSQKNKHGLDMGASGTAWAYSNENPGTVGIYIAPGNDLNGYTPEQLGTYLVNIFQKEGVEAECFISERPVPKGSAVDFNVNGLSWGNDRMLNLQQATDMKTLTAVVAEAKAGKALLKPDDGTTSSTSLNP